MFRLLKRRGSPVAHIHEPVEHDQQVPCVRACQWMYSLVVTARLNNIDPRAWLADVLDRIADHPASRLTNCSHGTGTNLSQPPAPPDNSRTERPQITLFEI